MQRERAVENDENLLSLENQVCFALAVASRSVNAVYRPLLEPLGLTHPQYLVLLALWDHSPRSLRELSTELQLEPATLSPLIKRLEAAGLVSRERSTSDERMLEITLTEAGLAFRGEAESVPPQVIERLGMPAEELHALRDSLWRIIQAARAAEK